jgi:hypothetical protein
MTLRVFSFLSRYGTARPAPLPGTGSYLRVSRTSSRSLIWPIEKYV